MAKAASITTPTEPIGTIPRPVDRIKRVAKGDSEPDVLQESISQAHRRTAKAATVHRPYAAEVSFMLHSQNYRFWRVVAQCLFGSIALALVTFVCFRLQYN